MERLIVFAARLLLAASMFVAPAHASMREFVVTWSGEPLGMSATAVATIRFDDAVLPQVGREDAQFFPGSLEVLSMRVAGAGIDMPDLGPKDFNFGYFSTPSPLDLSKELIGQVLANGCPFGTSQGDCGNGRGGDFNLYGIGTGTPRGRWYFDMFTGSGAEVVVTSMRPVPVLPPLTALASCIALLLPIVRRPERRGRRRVSDHCS